MKILKNIFGILFFGIVVFSCSNRSAEEAVASEEPATAKFAEMDVKKNEDVVDENSETKNATPVSKKKIIKDGNISIESSNITESKKHIDELLKTLNAYYDNEELGNYPERVSYTLKIRIPAENFEKLISALENGKDEIRTKNIEARDVTEEYVDVETRLVNKREYLKRYKELLVKASTIKDIIAIQENIRTLEEEIESKEGRLKYLNDQIAFSTLNINLYQERDYVYKPEQHNNFIESVKHSLSTGWTIIVDLVLAVISLWSIIILAIVAFFVVRKIRKRNKK